MHSTPLAPSLSPQSPASHPVHQFLCTLNATYSLSFHFTKYLSQKNKETEAKDTPRCGIFVIASFSSLLGLKSLHSKMAAITYEYILGISFSSQFPDGPMSLPMFPLLSLSPNSLPIGPSSLISPSSLHNTIFYFPSLGDSFLLTAPSLSTCFCFCESSLVFLFSEMERKGTHEFGWVGGGG